MPGTSLKTGYTNLQVMVKDVVTDMKAAGFDLLNAYSLNASGDLIFAGNSAPNHSETTGYYVLAPTQTVDPLAVEDGDDTDPNYDKRQPWRIVIEVVDMVIGNLYKNYIRFWVVPASQLITEASGLIRVAAYAQNRESGYLFDKNKRVADESAYTCSFFSRLAAQTGPRLWSCYGTVEEGFNPDSLAIPFSYLLSITDHGIAFSMWAENYDKAGDCFNWFTVQRLVKDDGSILLDEKSPLLCVFSTDGGGMPDSGKQDAEGILYFVVCEDDIHAPTSPISAVVPLPDSVPFINSMQQVSLMVNRNFVMQFPRGINTQRYYYPYKLDMVGYTSADVLSHKSLQTLTVAGQERQFRSINANSANNTGMRPLFVVKGLGIV